MIGQSATGIQTAPQANLDLLGGMAAVAPDISVLYSVWYPLSPPIMVTLQPSSSTVRWCSFLRGSSKLLWERVTEGIRTYKHNICRQHTKSQISSAELFDWLLFIFLYVSTTLWPWVS